MKLARLVSVVLGGLAVVLAMGALALDGRALDAQTGNARTRDAQTAERPLRSDFSAVETPGATSGPATRPAATAPAGLVAGADVVDDKVIGVAIERGTDFLLSQFKDGQLASAPELSETQLQGLDALCVYALVQSGRATGDPRLDPRRGVLSQMLTRLAGFAIAGDAAKMNRPVTYARSLRAAALAGADRAEDRGTLKGDVQWLIASQFEGAYSYDDLFVDMIKRGMKPTSSRIGPKHSAAPEGADGGGARLLDNGGAEVVLAQDFGGGSPDVGYGGPYGGGPPSFSPGVSPGIPNMGSGRSTGPVGGGGGGGGGGPSGPPPVPNSGLVSLPGAKNVFLVRVPVGPRPVPDIFGGNAIGPRILKSEVPRGPLAPGNARPGGDNGSKPEMHFEFPWDNSNSQYGLLGVWAGAEVGVEVPDSYWKAVEQHWLLCELASGQWTYRKNDGKPTFAMTCAGVASLLVTHDYLDLPMVKGAVGREPYSKGLASGLSWLDRGDNGVDTPNPASHYIGYDIFGLERVGLASGYKYFGSHNWYPEVVRKVVPAQFANGAWGGEDHGIDTLVDTAYTLLFLSRGRHPVLMTKLKFDKYWDNRPRDVANLAKFASKQLERQVNWQVVGIEHTWDEWFDSPVVYIASHQAPKLRDRDYEELAKFALAGGLIFTHADASSGNFDQWVSGELVKRIAPGRALVPIPDSDPIYSGNYKLANHRRLMGVSNGVRWLLVHSPNDIGLSWQMRAEKTRLQDLQLGLNVFLYAAGKPDLRNRLDSPFIAAPTEAPTKYVRVARLKYDGNWNPEPGAWGRFSRWLQRETGEALTLVSIPMDKVSMKVAPIAVLTGTGTHVFTKAECDALAAYVKDGGVVLIDSCGGDNSFRLSVREKLMPVAFGEAKATALPKELVTPMRLRPFSLARAGGGGHVIEIRTVGKGSVVFSPVDLTNAMLGTNTWGVDGYESGSAMEFVKKVVLWAGH